MAKLTAWLVTIIGFLLVLVQLGVDNILTQNTDWIVALSVLIIGIGKLMRNYSYNMMETKRRR